MSDAMHPHFALADATQAPAAPPAVHGPTEADARPLAPLYGAEGADYTKWKDGFPPFSGRMFGSGR